MEKFYFYTHREDELEYNSDNKPIKALEWHYECEWRFAVPDALNDDETSFDGIINDSPFKVTGVCYGYRCVPVELEDLISEDVNQRSKADVINRIESRTDIRVSQNTLSTTEFKLIPVSLEE
jgi:hypothetical protein